MLGPFNKLALLTEEGRVFLVNEDKGRKDKAGVWYSNHDTALWRYDFSGSCAFPPSDRSKGALSYGYGWETDDDDDDVVHARKFTYKDGRIHHPDDPSISAPYHGETPIYKLTQAHATPGKSLHDPGFSTED